MYTIIPLPQPRLKKKPYLLEGIYDPVQVYLQLTEKMFLTFLTW